MLAVIPICRRLLIHWAPLALHLALDKAGNNMAARMAMMAITTSNSIRVKPARSTCERELSGEILRRSGVLGFMVLHTTTEAPKEMPPRIEAQQIWSFEPVTVIGNRSIYVKPKFVAFT